MAFRASVARRLFDRRAAVGSFAVEVNQDVAGLGAPARADDAAVLQLVHDPRGSAIAQAQAALQQGHAGLLLAADDLDAVLDDLFVLVNAASAFRLVIGAGELLMDLKFVAGLGLFGDELDDALDFLVGNEGALGANQLGRAGRQVKEVALHIGFSDPYHFSRVFKREMGQSPRMFTQRRR